MLEKHASSSQPAGIQRAMALQGRVAFAWPAHAALDRVSHGWTLSAIDSPPNFLDGCITMRRRAPGHDRTRMPDKSDPPDDERALRARLDALSGKLKAQRPEAAASPRATSSKPPDNLASGMSMGLRAGSEFVAAILVGGAIGWGLDWALKTKPAFTIVFFLLGVAAGVWNVIRATSPKGAPPAT